MTIRHYNKVGSVTKFKIHGLKMAELLRLGNFLAFAVSANN